MPLFVLKMFYYYTMLTPREWATRQSRLLSKGSPPPMAYLCRRPPFDMLFWHYLLFISLLALSNIDNRRNITTTKRSVRFYANSQVQPRFRTFMRCQHFY